MLGNIYGLQFIFSDKFYLKTFYFMVLDLLRFVSNSKFKNILPKTKKTTSLKIFKHYKLKPNFSIIKDEKEKDKVGVGDKPPPPPPPIQKIDQI